MLIAIPSLDDNGLESTLSPHFGRCPFFVLVELDGTETGSIRTIVNPYASSHETGQIPAFAAEQGVEVMLAGGMGPQAIAAFASLGVRAVTGGQGAARRVLDDYARGNLSDASPCDEGRSQDDHGAADTGHRRRPEPTPGVPGRSGTPR